MATLVMDDTFVCMNIHEYSRKHFQSCPSADVRQTVLIG